MAALLRAVAPPCAAVIIDGSFCSRAGSGGGIPKLRTVSLPPVSQRRGAGSSLQSRSRKIQASDAAAAAAADQNSQVVAREGDMVTISYIMRSDTGEILHSSTEVGDENDGLLTFEVGVGNALGNPLFKGLDEAIRGLEVGETVTVQSVPQGRDEQLVFEVPCAHEEIQRIWTKSIEDGGSEPQEGSWVMLANGNPARICQIKEETIVIDANNPFADSQLEFVVTLRAINGQVA